ncbi:hypothetical protein DM01DRAFT_1378839 [Hesseltinella vesiculosa]|uniref:Uncharacterized protein n=1 Tax=Hesseltinella vesiculosa TaxID=101127 RepID=A0A1X2G2X1_9FUNG|nr:hypothetical protein DM01DRAFT_1378839 [Hesseltinella vesiculosa]
MAWNGDTSAAITTQKCRSPEGIMDDIASASEIDHDNLTFPVHWDTGKDVTFNDLMLLFNLKNDNADGVSHGFDMNTENKQLEEVAGTDDETSIKDLHHFAMLVNNTMNAIPFNTETEMELSIILGKFKGRAEVGNAFAAVFSQLKFGRVTVYASL